MNNKVDDLKQFVCFHHGSSVFTSLQLDYAESTLQQTFKLSVDYWIVNFQNCGSNIGLFSIAPHKVMALPTLR